MKTATIFGATGQVGHQLITHCLAKGWAVKAFGRNIESLLDKDNESSRFTAIKGYVFDAEDVRQAIAGSDFVLSALGGAFDGTDKARSLGMKNIVSQMKVAGVRRIIAVGGLGILPDQQGGYLLDDPDYPKEFLPVGIEHKLAFEYLRDSGLDWTFMCCPNLVNGDADGKFAVTHGTKPPTFEIFTGNLALFMTSELDRNEYLHQRVGISNT